MKKKIKFKTTNADLFFNIPKPSSKMLPTWFNQSSMNCMPFSDAVTSGYVLTLASDIYYKNGEFQEAAIVKMVDLQSKEQLGQFQIPAEFDNQLYKWINYFLIQTPKGYSSIIMHPMNRIDLPFYTLSGIVETDSFPATVSIPFFMKTDFSGVVKEGTPIAQIIPIKREAWQSNVQDDQTYTIPNWYESKVNNPPFEFYKKRFWKRKNYK